MRPRSESSSRLTFVVDSGRDRIDGAAIETVIEPNLDDQRRDLWLRVAELALADGVRV